MNDENELQTKRAYMSKIDLTAAWIQLSLFKEKNLYLWSCKTTNDYISNNLCMVYKLLHISLNRQDNIIINVQIRQYMLGKFKLRDNQT